MEKLKGLTEKSKKWDAMEGIRNRHTKPRSLTYPGTDSGYLGKATFVTFQMTVAEEHEEKVEKLHPMSRSIANDPE